MIGFSSRTEDWEMMFLEWNLVVRDSFSQASNLILDF